MRSALSLLLLATFLSGPAWCVESAAGNTGRVLTGTINVDGENALETGDYARAESIFSSSLSALPKGSSDEAAARVGLAEAELWQGKYDKAGKDFSRAQALFGKQSTDANLQARLLDDLSWLSQAKGNLTEAENYCRDGLKIRSGLTDVRPFDLVASLSHLAYLTDLNGRLEESADLYKQALKELGQAARTSDINVADLVEQLASIYWRQGKQSDAAELFQEALQVKSAARAAVKPYVPHPYWQDVIFTFYNGAPNCVRRTSQGQEQQIVTADGVSVAAAIIPPSNEIPKAVRVELIVRNDSGANIQFLSRPPVLTVMQPKMIYANLVDPTKLADSIEKKGDRKAAWVKFWGQDATRSVSTTVIGNGGWYPPVFGYGGNMPIIARSGNMTTYTTQVPDYAAQQRALAKAADISFKAKQNAGNIRAQTLGPTTVAPGRTVSGYLYFDITQMQNINLQIPVGNATYAFEFPAR